MIIIYTPSAEQQKIDAKILAHQWDDDDKYKGQKNERWNPEPYGDEE